MAGEIDRLEIQIEASASSAAEKIEALASSIEALGKVEIANATEGLQTLVSSLNGIKGNSSARITRNIDGIATAFSRLNEVGSIEKSVEILDNVENLQEALSGLSSISESIQGLRVGRTFETNLENLSLALSHLNSIGDTSRFADGVSSISEAINRLNNIEIGQGFTNIVHLSTQWADALERINSVQLGSEFSQGIARVARAAEILNEVDFSGFTRMNEALAALPDNVRISFGASNSEIESLTESLSVMQRQIESISSSVSNIENSRRRTPAQSTPDNVGVDTQSLENDLTAVDRFGLGVISVFQRIGTATGMAARSTVSAANNIAAGIARIGGAAITASIKAVFAPITALGNKFKETAAKAGQFLASIKRIAMYRVIRSALKEISEGFQEGRENLYQYSVLIDGQFAKSMDMAATSFLYLKNSIGAATAPLTNYLVPILDQLIDKVVDVINKFNELTAVLTGADTWTQAIKYPIQWKEAADDANKAAKKLKSTMLGFDELNVIEPNSTGSGSADDSGLDYSRMFREVEVSAKLVDLDTSWLAPIKLAWDDTGVEMLETVKQSLSDIWALITSVGETFHRVWMDGTGQETLSTIFEIITAISGTFGALASQIRNAWDENDRGYRIIRSIWGAANNILTVFRNVWNSIREWASNLDFSPLLDSLGALGEAIQKLVDPDGALAHMFQKLWDDILLPLGKWTIEEGAPAAVDALTASLDALRIACEFFEPAFNWLVDGLAKIGRFTGDNIVALLEGFAAVMAIGTGGEATDKQALALEKSDKNLRSVFDWDKDGSSWFSAYSDATQALGEWWFDFQPQFNDDWANGVDMMLNSSKNSSTGIALTGGFSLKKAAQETEPDVGTTAASFQSDFNSGIDSIMKKWETFKSDFASGWESIKSFPRKAMESIKKDVSEKWDAIKSSLKSGWSELKDKVSGWKEHWGEKVSAWESDASDKWASIKTNFKSGWEDVKTKVSDWKDDWATKTAEWKQDASDKWDEIKKTLTESSAWKAITEKADDLKNAFGSAFQWVLEKAASFRDTFLNIVSFVWSGADGNGGIKGVVNNILGGVEGMINYTVSGLNLFIDGVNELIAKASGVIASVGVVFGKDIPSVTGASIPPISEVGLPRLASGGILDAGQLFIARESGAEMVGQYHGKTAVVNNDQIVQSITDAVTDAFLTAFSAMKNMNEPSGGNEYRFYISGREIQAEVEKIEREKGSPVLGGVVYG